MTQTLDTRALNMLVARIVEEENRRFPHLAKAEDWPDFKRRVGFLEACEFIRKACEDVERDLYGGDTKKR